MEKIDEDVCGVGILSVILLGFIQSFVANAGTFCSYQNCLKMNVCHCAAVECPFV